MNLSFIFSRYSIIFILIVLFPLDQLFTSLFPNFSFSPFRIIVVLISIFFFQYNFNSLKPVDSFLKMFFAYAALAFMSVLWSSNPEKSMLYSIQILVSIFFAIVSISELSRKKNFYKHIVFYSITIGAFISVFGLLGFFSEREITVETRLSFANIGLNAVAISIGYTLILGVTGLFSKNQNFTRKVFLIIASLICFYFLIRTGTRSSIFGVLIALTIGYIITFKVSVLNVFKLILLVSILYFSFNKIIDEFIGLSLRERIFSIGMDDIESNVRSTLWITAYEWFSFNLLGTGAGNEEVAYMHSEAKEAHNIFISGLLQLGIIGFFILVIFTIKLLLIILKTKNLYIKYSILSLYIFLFLQMIKGSFVQNRIFWIPIIIIFSLIILDRNLILKNEIKTATTRLGDSKEE